MQPRGAEKSERGGGRARFGIATRVVALACAASVGSAAAIGVVVFRQVASRLAVREKEDLVWEARVVAARLRAHIERLTDDALQQAGTAPAVGLAAAFAHGVDPRDGSTSAAWVERFAFNLERMMEVKERYLQARFIDLKEGREIVRIDRRAGEIRRVPEEELQIKGDRDYVRESKDLAPDEVALYGIDLNRERGAIEVPHTPVLRAVSPVPGADGRALGLVVLNLDMNAVFRRVLDVGLKPGRVLYATNERGDYLLHPDPSETFAFEFGRESRLQLDHPGGERLLAGVGGVAGDEEEGAFVETEADGERTILAGAKVRFDPQRPERFLLVAVAANEADVLAGMGEIRGRAIAAGGLVAILAGGLSFLVARSTTRSLSRLTEAAGEFARSGTIPQGLPLEARDETGTLARALAGAFAEVAEQTDALRAENARRRAAEAEVLALNAGLEERVRERTERLEAVNRELETFSYSVSHDLRAPLRHIGGFADLLRKKHGEQLGEKGNRYVRTIVDSVRQMTRLIDDLLAFSQVGRAEMRPSLVDAGDIVREVMDTLVEEREGRDIEFRIGPLPKVHADANLLRLVFQNLISNAIKYTSKREKATIEIDCRLDEADGHVFRVADDGAGFDMKYADKLFGVFQRLHRADEFEGVGIGLANVKRIVVRHGGRVWAEGVPGEGATFHAAFPAHPPGERKEKPR